MTDWRPSKLPKLNGLESGVEAPNKPHRWLPVDASTNDGTSISRAQYSAWGPGWNDWRLAAQEHYSFFQNAEAGGEEGLVAKYGFETWDMNYERLSINFIAVWGRDIRDSLPMPRDDEQHLTQTMAMKLGRREFFQLPSHPPPFSKRIKLMNDKMWLSTARHSSRIILSGRKKRGWRELMFCRGIRRLLRSTVES
jgi:hypothetical protein